MCTSIIKRLIVVVAILLCGSLSLKAQHATYYYQRVTHFETLPTSEQDIIFLGNSISDGCEWSELFRNPNVKNRGISGDVTQGVLDRLKIITRGKPEKIFLLIGINDLARNISVDTIVNNIFEINARIQSETPNTKLYIQSILPVSKHYNMFTGHTSKGEEIKQINAQLESNAESLGYTFIDLYSYFIDPKTDEMNTGYTNDGLHLMGSGYVVWSDILKPYL